MIKAAYVLVYALITKIVSTTKYIAPANETLVMDVQCPRAVFENTWIKIMSTVQITLLLMDVKRYAPNPSKRGGRLYMKRCYASLTRTR